MHRPARPPAAAIRTAAPRTPAPVVLLVVLLLTVLAACSHGSGGGLGAQSPNHIVEEARAAARAATSLHIQGTWRLQGNDYRLDLRVKDDAGIGTVDTGSTRIGLLRMGQDLYVRGDAGLYQPRNGRVDPDASASAQALRDKYVRVPHDDDSYVRLASFTRPDDLVDQLFRLTGTLRKDGQRTVRGTSTLRVTADGGRGGELDVARHGLPFPLRFVPGGQGGALELFEYNQNFDVTLPPPDQLVDYGSLDEPTASSTAPPGTDADAG